MKTILATAYDVNPYKGSESGTGWNFIVQIARFNKVVAITRVNNKKNIEKYIEEFNIDITNIKFHYYDLPYYLRFWKKGARGSSLYFYLWQMFMPIFIKKNKIKFNIAHNLNFHTDSFPTFLWFCKQPLVWGPINHHEKIPYEYIHNIYSSKEYIKDRVKWVVKVILWTADPFLRISKSKSKFVLCGNSSVQKRLSIKSEKFISFSQIASDEIKDITKKETSDFNILFVGRLVPLKATDIAIKAFAKFYSMHAEENISMTIIGKGPELEKLVELVDDLNIIDSVKFINWIDKGLLSNYYKQANIFFFPSHEGAGMVIPEALSYAIPALCFDNFGPGELTDDSCATRIKYSNYNQSVLDFGEALNTLYLNNELLTQKSENAFKLFQKKYTWNSKGDFLKDLYTKIEI